MKKDEGDAKKAGLIDIICFEENVRREHFIMK